MPETRIERVLFALGLAAIAALGFLVAHFWHNSHADTSPPAPTSVSTHPLTTSRTRPAATTATTRTVVTRETNTAPAGGAVSLLLTAKADTWLEVRSGSANGPVLYDGTLAAGSSKRFRAALLWARFGAAGNLSARVGGKPLQLPAGTYSATVDRHGLRQVGG